MLPRKNAKFSYWNAADKCKCGVLSIASNTSVVIHLQYHTNTIIQLLI